MSSPLESYTVSCTNAAHLPFSALKDLRDKDLPDLDHLSELDDDDDDDDDDGDGFVVKDGDDEESDSEPEDDAEAYAAEMSELINPRSSKSDLL